MRDAEKKRLVKLIEEAKVQRTKDYFENGKTEVLNIPIEEYSADYLLDNGVIVPPCKVGDILYVISSNKQILPFVVNRIIITNYIKIKVDYIAGRDYEIKYLLPDYFGKTVFFSEAEAKYALKNRRSVSLVNGHIEE